MLLFKIVFEILSLDISKYPLSNSEPIKLLPLSNAILQVVPEPINGSNITSFGLDQEIIWSFASYSGKIAGCLKAISSIVE